MQNIKLIDSHAHLDFPDYANELDEVIKRAQDSGVSKIISVGTTLDGSYSCLALAKKHPFIYSTAGIHPHDAKDVTDDCYKKIEALAREEKVIAIGEVGLDFHYEHSPRETQKEVFRQFIRLAKKTGLPLVVHTREAEEETLQILESEKASEVGGVIHCFSGSLDLAKKCLQMGFHISIPGIVTFKKASNVHEVVNMVPIEKMLIETDSPFLAPIPYRGKRNEPAYVKIVAEKVAELKGLSLEDVARITTLNTERLFAIGENKNETEIAYQIRDSLYLNITNRCTNSCPFCAKNKEYIVKGHYLELSKEPSASEIIEAIGNTSPYKEIVFCGFGEPMIRLDTIREVAAWLKERGAKTRINTDGLANMIHKRNVLPELEGLIDSISISLNAENAEIYNKVCRPPFDGAYEGVKAFILEAKKFIPDVTASVVGLPSVDIEKCRRIVEKELGVKFRLRPYDEIG